MAERLDLDTIQGMGMVIHMDLFQIKGMPEIMVDLLDMAARDTEDMELPMVVLPTGVEVFRHLAQFTQVQNCLIIIQTGAITNNETNQKAAFLI